MPESNSNIRSSAFLEQDCLDILENLPIGVAVSTPEGRCISANQPLARMYGYDSPQDMMESGSDIPAQIYADQAEKEDILSWLESRGEVQNLEHRVWRKDGTLFWAQIHARANRDFQGKITQIQWFISDITEKQATQERLERSRNDFKILLDYIPVQVWYLWDEQTYGAVNSAHAQFFGLHPREIANRDLYQFMPPEEVEVCRQGNQEVFATGKTVHSEEWVQNASGEKRLLSITKSPCLDQQGGVAFVVCCAEDVTQRKQAEDALRESQEKYRLLIENLNEGIWQIDKEACTTFVNQSMAAMLGYSVDEMMGRHLFEFMDEQAARIAEENLGRCRQGIREQLEFEFMRKDGSRVYTLLESSPILDQEGNFIGSLAGVQDVTARKRLEQELKEQNNLLEAIINGIPDVLAIQYPDHSIERYNQAGYQILNMSPEEVRHHKCFQLIGRDRECQECATRTALHTKELVQLEKYVPELDAYLDCRSIPILNEQGEVVKIVEQLRDITSQKRAEEALKQSEKRYRSLVESQHDAIARIDRDGLFTYVNDTCCQVFGEKREELLGRPFLPFVHEEDLEEVLEQLERVHHPPYRMQISHRLITPSGFYWMHWENSAIFDDSGEIVEIQSVGRDITDMKLQQEKLELILEAAQNVSFVVTEPTEDQQDALIREFSPGAENLFGYAKEEALGKPVSLLHSQEEVEKFPEIHARISKNQAWHGRARLVRKSGEIFPALFTVYPFRVYGEQGTLGVAIDITELERAQQELIQAKEQAEAANRAKTQFLANMSHEIRTPMSGIMGSLDMLAEQLPDPESKRLMDMTRESARSLQRIIDDVLDLSKVEAGRMELQEQEFDFFALLDRVLSLHAVQAGHKDLRLEKEVPEGVPSRLVGDAHRLEQVLRNLVGNAVKFTSQGRVFLRVVPQGGSGERVQIRFEVLDTGPGIPEDFLPHLFESFTQADSSYGKRHQGTGLGLSISERLVRLMGGEISVQSVPGQGTVFYFTLPLGLPSTPEVSSTEDSLQEEEVQWDRPLRILVAEDVELNQEYIRFVLENAGHEVHSVYSGNEAVQSCARESYDAVLMDIQMPEMDGLEATRRIRSAEREGGVARERPSDGETEGSESLYASIPESRNSRIPIIALTAYAMPEERDKFLAQGMDGYVSKPVEPGTLLQELFRLVPAGRDSSRDQEASQESEASRESGLVDMEAVESRFSGHQELWQKLMDRFLQQELPEYESSLKSRAESGELEELARVAHKLKGALGTLCATPLMERAAALQQAAQNREQERIPGLLQNLIQGLHGLAEIQRKE